MKSVSQFGQALRVFCMVSRCSEGQRIAGVRIAKAEQAGFIT